MRKTIFTLCVRTTRLLPVFIGLFAATSIYAGSATWDLNPTSSDWNTAVNWTPDTVPNGPLDTATFAVSNTTDVSLMTTTEVNSIVFNSGASPFVISVLGQGSSPSTLTISGAGVINNSAITQQLVTGPAAAGGVGNITLTGNAIMGSLMTVTNEGGGADGITLADNASAGDAIFVNEGGKKINHGQAGSTRFVGNATAAAGTFFCETGSGGGHFGAFGGNVRFSDSSTAANGSYVLEGAPVADAGGGYVLFYDTSSAGNGVFTLSGSDAAVGGGAYMQFYDDSSAGNATLIVNGGTMDGGQINFFGDSTGDTARLQLFGNGTLNAYETRTEPLTIGSLEGDGIVLLGYETLIIGSNSLSTVFSGTIEDSTFYTGGALVKTGTGTLTLRGTNIYTGGTTVSQGTLVVANTTGSATGTGAVAVDAGTLGGSGTVAGAITVGTGSGAGAVLAPAAGSKVPSTLITSSTLALNADATYVYTGRVKGRRVQTDVVVANGVTINGATFSSRLRVTGTPQAGTVLTVISNTSANPISGTFNNLPDGGIVTINGNNFQADYEGGDGNDLTLTVIP